MERGVLVGGLLISASFLLTIMLNQAAKEPPARDDRQTPAVGPQMQAPDSPPAADAPPSKQACAPATPAARAAADDAEQVSPSSDCEGAASDPE